LKITNTDQLKAWNFKKLYKRYQNRKRKTFNKYENFNEKKSELSKIDKMFAKCLYLLSFVDFLDGLEEKQRWSFLKFSYGKYVLSFKLIVSVTLWNRYVWNKVREKKRKKEKTRKGKRKGKMRQKKRKRNSLFE